jgi:hypothetical protein
LYRCTVVPSYSPERLPWQKHLSWQLAVGNMEE